MENEFTDTFVTNKKKILQFIMRTFILLFCTTVFGFSSTDIFSQNVKIVINEDKVATIDEVFDLLREQTDYTFIYQEDFFKNAAKVHLKKGKIRANQLLKRCFSGDDYNFTINDDNKIIINKREPVEKPEQEIQISGTVSDSEGQPLPGANILEKGTTNGTQTDFDGNFSIQVADDNAILVVSYIGFTSQEVALANGQTNLTITLQEDAAKLDEVVLIGYGQQKAKDITSSIAVVDVDEASKFASSSPTQLLQGRAPGVSVVSADGAIGAQTNIVIRGVGTFTNSNPLFVIDGTFTDNMDFLNPQDIKSIQVLKDATATSIYGSRAANGVIIIETKKGTTGTVKFNASVSTGIQNAARKLKFLNARQYADVRNSFADENGIQRAPANDAQFNPNIDTDWQDLQLESLAPISNYYMGVSGGGSGLTYSISSNFFDQKGIVTDSKFNRFNLTANSAYTKGRLTINQSIILSREKTDFNNDYRASFVPTVNPFNPDNDGGFGSIEASLHGVTDGANPLGLARLKDDEFTKTTVLGNLNASYEFFEGLTYKINLGVDLINDHQFNFVPTYLFSTTDDDNVNTSADLTEQRREFLTTLLENTLTYDQAFGDHTVNAVVGHTSQKGKIRGLRVIGSNFPSNSLSTPSGATDKLTFDGNQITNGLISYFGRVNYGYKNKYLLSGSFRRDGSSRFGVNNRYGNFSSFSLGWRISDESFFDIPAITDLKLRGGIGTIGAQNIADYAILSSISSQSQYNLGAEALVSGSAQLSFANPDLKWEETKTTNIGLDLELEGGKVTASMEYFKKETNDILANIPIPSASGSSQSLPANAASIENKGFEMSVSYRKGNGDFTYNLGGNFAILDNLVTSLGQGGLPINSGVNRTEAGQAFASFYGRVVDGVFQSQAEIDAYTFEGALIQPLAQVGDFRFKDLNNDGQINNDGDRTFIGSPFADFEFGLNFSANYKQFDFSLFFQGTLGNEIYNGFKSVHYFGGRNNNYIASFLNDSSAPRLSDPENDSNLNGQQANDFSVENGSYGKLKLLQLGYTLPESILSSIGFESARFYLSAQNLFTITSFDGGYDPEVGVSGGIFSRGVISRSTQPFPRTFILGVDFRL